MKIEYLKHIKYTKMICMTVFIEIIMWQPQGIPEVNLSVQKVGILPYCMASSSCGVIGYLTGQNATILPTKDYLPCP